MSHHPPPRAFVFEPIDGLPLELYLPWSPYPFSYTTRTVSRPWLDSVCDELPPVSTLAYHRALTVKDQQ